MSYGSARFINRLAVTNAISRKINGSVIILHGSCDSGSGMKEWLNKVMNKEFKFYELRILFPSAPIRPYSLLNGQETNIWFDRLSLSPQFPEDRISIESTAEELQDFIKSESQKYGIPLSQMILGGFSMGGSMAIHIGYRYQQELAGVFGISTFLAQDSMVYETLKEKKKKLDAQQNKIEIKTSQNSSKVSNAKIETDTAITAKTNTTTNNKTKLPELFMSQGVKDPLVNYEWAKATFSKLKDHGVEGHFFTHPKTTHGIDKTQLTILHQWISHLLADPTSTNGTSTNSSKLNSSKK